MACRNTSRPARPALEPAHTIMFTLFTHHPDCDCFCAIYGRPFDEEGELLIDFEPCVEGGEVHDGPALEAAGRSQWSAIEACAQKFADQHELDWHEWPERTA